jgi:hypothetical protein
MNKGLFVPCNAITGFTSKVLKKVQALSEGGFEKSSRVPCSFKHKLPSSGKPIIRKKQSYFLKEEVRCVPYGIL